MPVHDDSRMIMKRILLFIAIARLSLGQEAVDLCDVLKNLEAWNGKLVEVHGTMKIWSNGVEGGAYLYPPVCDAQIRIMDFSAIPVQESTFTSGVELADPQARTAIHKVDFQWDRKERDRYRNAMNRIDRDRQYIKLTVVGMFETRVPLSRLVSRGTEMGFGHMGYLPGHILVKTIKDIVVEKK